MNLLFTLLIAIFAGLSAFIPSAGKLVDNRRKGIKWLNPLGWKFVFCILFGIILIAVQNIYNQFESDSKEEKVKNEQAKRDSIQKKNYELSLNESNIKTIVSITKTLGEYGFRFDSLNNRLIKIVRDSSKTKIIEGKIPILTLCTEEGGGITFDSTYAGNLFHYSMHLCSYDAASTNYNVAFFVIVKDTTNQYHLMVSDKALAKYDALAEEQIKSIGFSFDAPFQYRHLYVFIKGTYSNADRSKNNLPISSLFYYNRNNKQTTTLNEKSTYKLLKSLKIDSAI